MTTETTLHTAEELFCSPDDGVRRELVKGEILIMPPTGGQHGQASVRLSRFVDQFVDAQRLGHSFGAETGFRIAQDPDTVRAPDFAFVARGRFPGEQVPSSFPELAPDLVAEVVSPSDTARRVEEKVHDWLAAGVRMVWVVYPSTRSVTVYRSLIDIRIVTDAEALDGADVLPGFTCPVKDLFPAS